MNNELYHANRARGLYLPAKAPTRTANIDSDCGTNDRGCAHQPVTFIAADGRLSRRCVIGRAITMCAGGLGVGRHNIDAAVVAVFDAKMG